VVLTLGSYMDPQSGGGSRACISVMSFSTKGENKIFWKV